MMKTLRFLSAVPLVAAALVAPQPPAFAAVDEVVITDSRTDVPTGVGLSRVRVQNGDEVVITTRHRNLRKKAIDNFFTIWIDTRTSHPGPDFVISGGLAAGTDWATGRATRHWHTRIDPLDELGRCDSDVDISWKDDKVRVALGRDCLRGRQGRVRVAVQVGDDDYTDWVPARQSFSRWLDRG